MTTPKLYEGAALQIWGHSYAAIPFVNATPSVLVNGYVAVSGGEYGARLGQRYGFSVLSKAVGGSRMADMALGAIGTNYPGGSGDHRIAAGSSAGLVIVDCEINDILSANADTTAYQEGFKHSLRSFLAQVETVSRVGGQKIESSSATASGTWGTNSGTEYSGGSNRYTSAQNAYLQWTNINTNGADHVWIYTYAVDSAVFAGAGGQFSVLVDGVYKTTDSIATYPNWGSNEAKQFAGLAGTQTFVAAVIKVPIDPASSLHTIRITKTDASTSTGIYVDALYVPGTAPMPVIVLKDPPCVSSNAGGISGYTYTTQYAYLAATYHSLIDTVVAEFPNAYALDLDTPTWDPVNMVNSTDAAHLHPDDSGNEYIADTVGAFFESTVVTDYPNLSPGVSFL